MRNPFRKKTDEEKEAKRRKKVESHEYKATEHQVSTEEVASSFGTVLNLENLLQSSGLPSQVASKRLEEEGRNRLSPPKQTPEWLKFLLHFTNLFMLLLTGAGILSCVSYAIDTSQPMNLYLGIILFVIVVLTCVISYIQERSSGNVMNTFTKMLPLNCRVIRDGVEKEILAEELVRGDLVRFAVGDKVPADMKIIMSRQAKVECSSITGESVPITLTAEQTSERPTESRNLVFNGSLCLNGEALGIVFRTGDNTLIGEIAQLAGAQGTRETTLQREVNYFVKFIGILSFVMALIFFIIGMARGGSFVNTFVNGFIVVIVANVPQGLPATVTSVIGVAAKKMAKKNVFVKRLDCVETLGSTSLICSDKTGTLTQNLMTVVSFWFNEEFVHTDGGNTLDSVLMIDLLEDDDFEPLLHCAALCNRAKYSDEDEKEKEKEKEKEEEEEYHGPPLKGDLELSIRLTSDPNSPAKQEQSHRSIRSIGKAKIKVKVPEPEVDRSPSGEFLKKERNIVGDASDTAIFRFVNTLGMVERIRRDHPKEFEIPFNSTIKYSVAIVDNPIVEPNGDKKPRHTLYIKGAPEIILEKCRFHRYKGDVLEIEDKFHTSVKHALKRCGIAGQRVLAFAMIHLPEPQEEYTEELGNFPLTDLTFLGLVALVDPPRPNVPKAVETLKQASIKVYMVTGDHPITAEAIARQVNIIKSGKTHNEVAAMRGVPASDVSIYDPEVEAVVLTGQELNSLSDDQWDQILRKKEIVFARTTPAQKLEIVERNQAIGHVVAVTGDGVNDSPALKAADVGVAMGKMGSDVSREAADLILITDDFAAIVDGVKMGRTIFDNLKKTIAYTLGHLFAEILPVLCTLAFSIPFGLNSIQILCIDLGTELFPAISLAYEKPEPKIMKRRPRDMNNDRLVSRHLLIYSYLIAGVVEALTCVLAYLLVFLHYGIPLSFLPFSADEFWKPGAPDILLGERVIPAEEQVTIVASAQSAWFITLVTSQFWHIWFVRTRKVSTFTRPPQNIVMIFGVIIELCLLVIIVYVPFLQPYLGTNEVPGYIWVVSLAFALIIGCATEFFILQGNRKPHGFVARYLAW